MFTFTALLVGLGAALTSAETSYTAAFDPFTGVSGGIQMKITSVAMYYSYTLDLTNFETTCDLSQGLSYHIHTYWKDESATSSIKTCGDAGGHYDPYLACGPSSQAAGDLCKALNRTASQGYVYDCKPDVYSTGRHYACEVGDLSGKFGRMMPDPANPRRFVGSYVDPSPPLTPNFGKADGIANQWASFVVHCPSDNSRVMCAAFLRDKC
jgi:hypothetical protein